jgi:rare lipoprotein A
MKICRIDYRRRPTLSHASSWHLVPPALGLALVLAGCAAKIQAPRGLPATQTGLATFYGAEFQGERTASGEPFDPGELVAAHPAYPFGTQVRVVNLENGRAVQVRIIDRGPAPQVRAGGVIIDVSLAAARRLGMVQDGRVRVRIEVLKWGRAR